MIPGSSSVQDLGGFPPISRLDPVGDHQITLKHWRELAMQCNYLNREHQIKGGYKYKPAVDMEKDHEIIVDRAPLKEYKGIDYRDKAKAQLPKDLGGTF